jgi:hypothetical protein
MRKALLCIGALLWFIQGILAQSTEEVKKIAAELSSEKYHGRGYEKQGDKIAAKYIATEFTKAGLFPAWDSISQPFKLGVNLFEGNTSLAIDGKVLMPGKDFLIKKSCPKISQTLQIIEIPNEVLSNPEKLKEYKEMDLMDKVVVIDYDEAIDRLTKHDTIPKGYFNLHCKAYVMLTDKQLRWFSMPGNAIKETIGINLSKKAYKKGSKELNIDVQSTFINDYTTSNVAGIIKGKTNPEKYVVVCGHYDHLGMHGTTTYFPGADDNASGIGSIIELARYYAKPENQPSCSIIFAAFSGEEMGLLGATHFANNPPVPLESIVSVINLDMVGFGKKDFIAFNGNSEPELMSQLETAKAAKDIDITLTPNNNINQSDHFPFSEKKVHTVFLTSGVKDSPYYHSVDDTMDNTTFAKAEELMKLIIGYIESVK